MPGCHEPRRERQPRAVGVQVFGLGSSELDSSPQQTDVETAGMYRKRGGPGGSAPRASTAGHWELPKAATRIGRLSVSRLGNRYGGKPPGDLGN